MTRKAVILVIVLLVMAGGVARGVYVEVTTEALGVPPAEVGGWQCISWPDYDNDGWPDVHISSDVLYRNNGDGTFSLVSGSGLGTGGISNYRSSWADADNDGDLDCVQACFATSTVDETRLAYYFESSGAPDYTFTRYPYYASPLNTRAGHPLFVDGDGDGFCEIYQATFGNWAPDYGRTYDRYFEADGGETFTEVTGTYIPELLTPEYERHTRGLVACDYDMDRDIDIFVTVYGVDWVDPSWENFLWQNDGTGSFTDVATEAGVAIEPNGRYGIGLSSGASWGDYDNDGDFDLAVANIHGWLAIYRNDGDGTFTELDAEEIGLIPYQREWHNTLWVDVDNDGDLDLFGCQWYEMPAFVWENEGPENLGHFRMATTDFGFSVAEFREITGFGAADYDRDGDMDIFYDGGDNEPGKHLFRNDLDAIRENNHWLVLHLVGSGTTSALTAAGAQVRLEYEDGWSGVRQVETTSSDQTMNMHPVHFGLGDHDTVLRVHVWWPDGTWEYWRWQDIGETVDQWLTLVQGTAQGAADVNVSLPDTHRGIHFERIVPSPARHDMTCHLRTRETGWIDLNLHDAAGRLLRRKIARGGANGNAVVTLSVSDLSAGTYWLRARTSGGEAAARTVVIIR